MIDLASGRDVALEWLERELIGPSPAGPPRDLSEPFQSKAESYGPYVDAETGEEVLGWTRPLKRYGVGVLFPTDSAAPSESEDDDQDGLELREALSPDHDAVTESAASDLEAISSRASSDTEGDGSDLGAVNDRRPSAMALSFLLLPDAAAHVEVSAEGGTYEVREIAIQDRDAEGPASTSHRRVYVRRPWRLTASLDISQLPAEQRMRRAEQQAWTGAEAIAPVIEMTCRQQREDGSRLVTVALVNRTGGRSSRAVDERSLFQTRLTVTARDGAGGEAPAIGPYPGPPIEELDEEERSLVVLYRDVTTYAVGHGCSATWADDDGSRVVAKVAADPLPVAEVPSVTPDIVGPDGHPLDVPMAPLAGLTSARDPFASLEQLVGGYSSWIESLREQLPTVPRELNATAESHIERCQEAAARMTRGIEVLRSDCHARRAFELMNRVILVQQLRSDLTTRRAERVSNDGVVRYDRSAPIIDETGSTGSRGRWRPFQLAFILSCLSSTTDPEDIDRETVELIFFPTGGGKTEAYLGLTAFSVILRRLRDPMDDGVDVLMRYTLRLLTAQQFLRASRLICAMEEVRRRSPRELGDSPITIGIWLGRATTPNTRRQAVTDLRRLLRDPAGADNPFLLDRCPWCAAELGPVNAGKTRPTKVIGYEERGGTVRVACPDGSCPFHEGLPVRVVDEDIYNDRPSLVIGTVDKFAMLAWRDDTRSLFGLGRDGSRRWSPPTLIVQDELHLISGPLGSMVGLYEGVVEELCTDHRAGKNYRPKIVTSTATIRGFESQVRSLFARERCVLFPPHGLGADDSFFARYARDDGGKLLPGRRYVGVHAGNHSSLIETQVAVMSALLQAGQQIEPEARDPWWTQLVFFNTLRELGTSLSLLQSSVPMQLKSLERREGLGRSELRRIQRVVELTSRLRNDEVPRAIASLETRASDTDAVDVCLASNIIEVGIDIDRLSLMVVVGQPKTTSQYIQVTGRVGRRWWERPGLVVTLLNPGRPRDRSHYERFRTYHERLYAQVEPTSVTPFSPSAIDRGLHGALVAFLRQLVDLDKVEGPSDVPPQLLDRFGELMQRRVEMVDPVEASTLTAAFERRNREWRDWSRLRWQRELNGDDGLLLPLGEATTGVQDGHHWAAPMSMRSVDAECELKVTLRYSQSDPTVKEDARG